MLVAANLLLALVWSGLFGSMDFATFTSGYAVGYLFMALIYRAAGEMPTYFTRPWKIAGFAIFYLKELVVSNVVVALSILSPRLDIKPGVIAMPLKARTDLEITLLANLITMTPGTLSLDVSPDRSTLFVHAMNIDNAETLKRQLAETLEKRVLDILR